jgi:hypothetical protein
VQGLFGIDVDNFGISIFARQVNMNLDPHPHAQSDRSRDQCSMKVDDDCLAFASQRFSNPLSLDHDPERNPSASSGFAKHGGGKTSLLERHFLLHATGNAGKYIVRVPAHHMDRADDYDENYGKHYRVLRNVLAFRAKPLGTWVLQRRHRHRNRYFSLHKSWSN